MISLVINGAAGRMGKRILDCAIQEKDWEIVGAIEDAASPFIGRDAGELAGSGSISVPISSDIEKVLPQAQVVIDFTLPQPCLKNLKAAVTAKKPMVIGTTGFSEAEKKKINEASKTIPVLLAPNMSVGVNLLFAIAGEVAAKLGKDYDIEIVEAHHRFKKDAPSGTAKRLAEVVAEARGLDIKKNVVYGREGEEALRQENEIAVHAVRAGDIVGEHTVTFCATGERIELTHRAHTRDTFAKGALRAARFLATQKPGLYSMQEVLGLT